MRKPSIAAGMRALVVALVPLLTPACTQTRWTHPASDATRTAADLEECDNAARIEAQQQVMFERLSGPRVIRNGVIGYPAGRGGFQERNSEWYWTQQFLDACMRRKGYRLVQVG
jgi:hypothetical protein